MRVGSIVLSSTQGLGILAKDFYDAGLVDEVLIKRKSKKKHNLDWYPSAKFIGCPDSDFHKGVDLAESQKMINFLSKIDLLLLFELPFFWSIYEYAREMGVKVCLMPMYEVTPLPQYPDAFVCPSRLDQEIYKKNFPEIKSQFIRVPTHSAIKWRLRKTAKTFVHNAGNGSSMDRNGTRALIDSMKYIKSPIKLLIRTQNPGLLGGLVDNLDDPRLEVVTEEIPFDELWKTGDVFIFPERFNGLSLPIQEAFASGMMIMCGDRFPFNSWLPKDPLIPVDSYEEKHIIRGQPFQSAIYDPKKIAKAIDRWYGEDITEFSLRGKEWAEANSWENLKPKYIEYFKEISDG